MDIRAVTIETSSPTDLLSAPQKIALTSRTWQIVAIRIVSDVWANAKCVPEVQMNRSALSRHQIHFSIGLCQRTLPVDDEILQP